MDFLDLDRQPRSELHLFVEYYHATLKNQTIKSDDWINTDRFSTYFCNHPAYIDCLMNLTNETFTQSLVKNTIMSGPFITEKTWKPLLAGTAVLSQGPCGVYQHLEQFGFKFDYPWSKSFDAIPGDIDRFLCLLKVVDDIFAMDFELLALELEPTCKFNQEHILSNDFFSTVEKINDSNLHTFMQDYHK
jgi:hypothetical protein